MANNLTYLPLDNIGINGLNTQSNPTSLAPSWLIKADNIAFKESGRITFRNGFVQQVLPTTAVIGSLLEHKDGVSYKIFAGVGQYIYTVDLTSAADAFPETTKFDGGVASDWQFINFNKQAFGFQEAHDVSNYDGSDTNKWAKLKDRTGNIMPSDITSFDPSCGTGYYGRLWVGGITEEKDVVHYSDTLIPTTWYNNTSVTTIAEDTNYIIDSVNVEAVTAVTSGIGYKIKSFKELDPTDGITVSTSYKIISDNRTVIDDTLLDGIYYEIGGIKVVDWSSVGGSSTAKVGDVFKCSTATDISTLGAVRLTWLNLGGKNDSIIGDSFTASDTNTDISAYGTVRLNNWSALGGSANTELNDLFAATSTSEDISNYGEVELDWQEIGGPEIANVNDAFKATVTNSDISAYGAVVPNYGLAGYIDLKGVWGTDEIVAIAPFYGKLVIFGKHNIAIYNKPDDPSNMELDEVIRGIGCVSRDSVQQVADDLFFLSDTGLRSLNRTTELDKVPLTDMSVTIRDNIIRDTKSSANIKGAYIDEEGLYVLSFIDIDIVYVFDMRQLTPAKTPRVTTWNFKKSSFNITALLNSEAHEFLVGQQGGSIAKYEGFSDKELTSATPTLSYDDNQAYTGVFQTTWIDLGEGVTAALLKKLKAVIGGGGGTDMSVKWDRDFGVSSTNALTTKLSPPGTDFLYNVAKYSCNNDNEENPGDLGFDYTSGDMCVYEDDGLAYDKYVEEVDPGDGEPLYVENTITSGSPIATRNAGSNFYFCHPLSAAPTTCEVIASEYAGVKGLKEYNIPLSKSAKYVQFTFTAETAGASTVLQDLTLLFKRGKIR